MSDQPDLPTPDGFDTSDAFEAALTGALEHRAGGSFAEATMPAGTPTATDARLASIEAGVATGPAGQRRTGTVLAIAAAVTLVLFVSIAVARGSGDSSDVQSGGGSTTSSTASPTTTSGTSPPETQVAPVPVGTSVPAPLDIRSADLANFTYPSTVCPADLELDQPSITLADGKAVVTVANRFGGEPRRIHVELVQQPHHGDVTSDGIDDAVVTIVCVPEGTDYFPKAIVVVSGAGDKPTVIGVVLRSTVTLPGFDFEELVDAAPKAGHLVGRWELRDDQFGDPRADRRLVTVTFHWNGLSFAPEGQPGIEVVPAPPMVTVPPPPPEEVQAIRRADLRNITLPLATDRLVYQTACRMKFADLAVADAQLADGVADVVDPSGNPVDASVAMEDEIRYVDLTGDGIEEAIVIIRCRNGATTARTIDVLGLRDGLPVFLDSLASFAGSVPFSTVVDFTVSGPTDPSVASDILIVVQYESPGNPPEWAFLYVTYAWNAATQRFDVQRCSSQIPTACRDGFQEPST
jgi:hypothetical protein